MILLASVCAHRLVRGRGRRVAGVLLPVLWLLPLLPHAVVEVQTALYGRQLLSALRRDPSFGYDFKGVRLYKVLSLGPRHARLYVVSECGESVDRNNVPIEKHMGNVFPLARAAVGWRFTGDDETAWSDCGSAEGNVFPPYFGTDEF